MEEGVRWAGGGFLIQISCGLTQQSLESKVTLGSLTVLYANRAAHLASGAGLLRGYLCKSDWVRAYCHSTGRHVCISVSHTHTDIPAVTFHKGCGTPCSPRIGGRQRKKGWRRKGSRKDWKRTTGQTLPASSSTTWLVGTVLFPPLPQKLALTRWLSGGGWLELNLHPMQGPMMQTNDWKSHWHEPGLSVRLPPGSGLRHNTLIKRVSPLMIIDNTVHNVKCQHGCCTKRVSGGSSVFSTGCISYRALPGKSLS